MNAAQPVPGSYIEGSSRARKGAVVGILFIAAFSASIMLGWLTQSEALLLNFARQGYTAFDTALLFLVCCAWLALVIQRPTTSLGLRRKLALLLLVLPVLVMFEHLSGIDLGIDLRPLHHWVHSNLPVLGRMAPNTAISFMLIGGIFSLYDMQAGRYRRALLSGILCALLFAIAGISLLGYALKLEWLYQWFAFNRMGLNTALAMNVLSVLVFLTTQPRLDVDEARRVNLMALGMMTLVAVVSALAAFAVFREGMQQSIAANIKAIADSRTELLLASIQHGQQMTLSVANHSELHAYLGHIKDKKHGALEPLQRDLKDDAIALGLNFIQLRDVRGRVVTQVGGSSEEDELELPLRTTVGKSSLVWTSGILLRNVVPIRYEGRMVGEVFTEEALPEIEKIFRFTDTMGKSGELKLCGKEEATLACFPSRLIPKVQRLPFYDKEGQPSFPVARAILGESGSLDVVDFRGIRVFASYRPVGDTGLGLVAKMDSVEVYAPVRTSAAWFLIVPLLLIAGVAYLINRYLAPITTRLQDSEQAARELANLVSENLLRLEHARHQLAEAEARARAIVENAHEAYIEMDPSGTITSWNQSATDVLGYAREEVIGQPLAEKIIPKRFRDRHFAGLRRYMEAGVSNMLDQRLEVSALHKGGFEVPVELSITVIKVDEEMWFSCFLHDVSERKKAISEIQLREGRLRSLTDSLPILVAHIDAERRYQYCNQTHLQVFGVEPQDVIGKTINEFFGDETYAILKPNIDRALQGERVVFERSFMALGQMRHMEGRYIPQRTLDGKIIGMYVTAWDITDSRRRELVLADKASKDALTGLFNRDAILEILDREIQDHYQRRDGLAVFFLDVDKFKHVNDTLGHAAGDGVLTTFAKRLQDAVRTTDFVARLGGDEFVIVLSSVDSENTAATVAQKVIEAIGQPMLPAGRPYSISTSIGIAYIENRRVTAAELLAAADKALYMAKQAGRNTFRMADMNGQ